MERCPTCKAPYKGEPVCHRCGTDLGLLIQIEDNAAAYLKSAAAAFASGDFERAFGLARRSLSLYQSKEARHLMADAAMLTGRFQMAMQLPYQSGHKKNLDE
jgi:hypothetical protein